MSASAKFRGADRHPGLLGDKIVDITPGTPDAPPLRPGATIAAQDPQEMSRMFAEGRAR